MTMNACIESYFDDHLQIDEMNFIYGIQNTTFIIFEGASCIKRKIFASKKIIFTIKTIRSGV